MMKIFYVLCFLIKLFFKVESLLWITLLEFKKDKYQCLSGPTFRRQIHCQIF